MRSLPPSIQVYSFPPLREGSSFASPYLFKADLSSSAEIRSLLEALPQRFQENPCRNSAFCSAIRGALAALAMRGGHIIVFQSSRPSAGPGALPPQPDENAMYDTEKETNLHKTRDKVYLDIAEECVDEGVGVTLFLAPNSFMDLGSIGCLASFTGGDIFFHPRYEPARDQMVMDSQLLRVMRRLQGFNCNLVVRTGNGSYLHSVFALDQLTVPTTFRAEGHEIFWKFPSAQPDRHRVWNPRRGQGDHGRAGPYWEVGSTGSRPSAMCGLVHHRRWRTESAGNQLGFERGGAGRKRFPIR